MFYRIIPILSVIFISCGSIGNSYHKFSNYKKCKEIEKGLFSKYFEPDVIQKTPHIEILKWFKKNKTIIFQKSISGSCSLKTIKSGG